MARFRPPDIARRLIEPLRSTAWAAARLYAGDGPGSSHRRRAGSRSSATASRRAYCQFAPHRLRFDDIKESQREIFQPLS